MLYYVRYAARASGVWYTSGHEVVQQVRPTGEPDGTTSGPASHAQPREYISISFVFFAPSPPSTAFIVIFFSRIYALCRLLRARDFVPRYFTLRRTARVATEGRRSDWLYCVSWKLYPCVHCTCGLGPTVPGFFIKLRCTIWSRLLPGVYAEFLRILYKLIMGRLRDIFSYTVQSRAIFQVFVLECRGEWVQCRNFTSTA